MTVQVSEVTCVLDAQARLGECPRWDETTQTLYWVDIKSHQLHSFVPSTGTTKTLQLTEEIGCFAVRERGGFVAGLRSGLVFIDSMAGGLTPIGDPEADYPQNRFNDGRCDSQGRFWAGTLNETKKDYNGTLYKLDTDGTITAMTGGYLTSNGLAFSTDDTTLYFADTPRHVVYAFDYDSAAGTIANQRPLIGFPAGGGRPDGAAVDADGYYWSAQYNGGCVHRISPAGDIVETLTVPAKHCTMVAFGGPDLTTLYITTARDNLSAEEITQHPYSGGIFAVQLNVAGTIEPKFKG